MFKVLIAASPSFTNDIMLESKCNYYLQHKKNIEVHCITLKHFTQSVKMWAAKQGHQIQVHARDFVMDGHKTTQVIYRDLIEKVDATIVFWDGESKNEAYLINMLHAQNCKRKFVVVNFESLKQELDRLKKEGKVEKRKKITIPLSKFAKERYEQAHEQWYKREYPTAYKDGHYSKAPSIKINSGAAMDNFIVNFIVWSGYSATKVSVMMKNGSKFIRTGAKPGTFDLTATIKGRSVKLETKHSSDKPSDKQLEMQERERRSGAIAEFIYNVDEAILLFDKIVNNEI